MSQERLDVDPSLFLVTIESFNRGVESDLVPVLEAVGESLLSGVDTHSRAVEDVRLYPRGVGLGPESKHADGRIVEPRRRAGTGDGQVDLVRNLRRQVVEGEGRDEADDP